MAALPCRHLLVAVLCALLSPLAAQAQYAIEKITFAGEPAPGGGTLGFLPYYVDLDEDGHVVFWSDVNFGPGEESGQIVAVHDGTALQVVLRNGDPLPGGAGTLLAPGFMRIRSGGALAWLAAYSPVEPIVGWGAFRRIGGIDTAIALVGDPAPGGGTFTRVRAVHVMNAAHDVAFHAKVDAGEPEERLALFVSRAPGLSQVMRGGEASPIGGAFAEPFFHFRPGLAGDGSVAFWAEVDGGSAAHGLFRWTPGGAIAKVVAQGDIAPDGGVVDYVGQLISMNEQGDICVSLSVSLPGDLFPMERIYVLSGTQMREVIRRGDRLPATGGIFLGHGGSTPPVVDANGDVVFAASIDHYWWWTTLSRGVFVSRDGVLEKVALQGEPVPGVPGATFSEFDQVEMNDAGEIAFWATSNLGTGIFLATPGAPPQIPLAPPLALAALAALIALAGAVRLRARKRHLAVAAVFCALLAPERAPAQPAGYAIETIALEGDPAPGGGTLGTFYLSKYRDLDADGRAAFFATAYPVNSLLQLFEGGALQPFAQDGDPAPGTGGESFTSATFPRLGAAGALAWRSTYTPLMTPPSLQPSGVFTRVGGVVSALILAGQPAPGGGSFQELVAVDGMNPSGDVLFRARVDLGADVVDGLFLARGGSILTVVRQGDAAPVPGGGVFETDTPGFEWRGALSDAGAVAFRAGITGGSLDQGVFVWTEAGGIVPRLLPGDPVQTPKGGTYTAFGAVITLNDAGEVVLEVGFERPGLFAPSGVFVVGPTSQREIAVRYDELPGTGGHQYGQLSVGAPRLNAAGDVAFTASFEEAGGKGLFVSRGHVLERIVLSGPVPDRPGVSWIDQHDDAVLNDAGQLLLHAYTNPGFRQGLFLATPVAPEIPLAPPLALGALGALIALAGGAAVARARSTR